MIISSIIPTKYPETAPKLTPMTKPKIIVLKANDNEVVVPCNTLEKISLPVVSVPIKCSKLGGARAFEGLTWSNSIRINDDPIGNNRMQDLIWADLQGIFESISLIS